MKFCKILILLVIFSCFLVPFVCRGANGDILGTNLTNQVATNGGYGGQTEYGLSATVGRIIEIALSLVGTIFLVLAVYAGFLWMTAGGEEEKVTKSKAILQQAVIGLAIALAAYSITYFVVKAVVGVQSPQQVGDDIAPNDVPPEE